MNKQRVIFTIVLGLVSIFCTKNFSYAQDIPQIQTKYPDFSYEFVGIDKFENFNRKIFKFNTKVNDYVLRPVNRVWASVMPKYGTERLQSVYTNIESPIRIFSCLLEKDFKASKCEAKRFLINTTIGFAGAYDPAKKIFKIEQKQEDMGQVLSHFHMKKGPYVVIPVVAFGNTRDILGKILDCPFNPSCYIVGPIALVAKTVLMVNKITCEQPLLKSINSTFADPYEIAKKLYGVDRYIKNANIDRKEVLEQKTSDENIININQIVPTAGLKPDKVLNNYNSQGALNDSLRTSLYNDEDLNKSIWGELSVWNRTFGNKIKTSYVKLSADKPPYKFRYILQKSKTAPLAILYPSIGEGITSYHSVVLGKMLYESGYSVLIQGSSFQWEFAQSMPGNYAPGIPSNDAEYLRMTTLKILEKLQAKYSIKPENKILIGTSFGALTGLFTAAQEDKDNTLGISKYICVSPPVDIFYALRQIDKVSQDWKSNPNDIKMRVAVTSQKVLNKLQETSDEKSTENLAIDKGEKNINFSFTEDETKLILGAVMKQKLSDLIFTLENGGKKMPNDSKTKMRDLYAQTNNTSFYDYAEKYLTIKNIPEKELEYSTSLYSIADFLKNGRNFKIYEAVDDYYTKPEHLVWLKNQTGEKSVFFNDGSHLGYLYRKEFQDCIKQDVAFSNTNSTESQKGKFLLIRNKAVLNAKNN